MLHELSEDVVKNTTVDEVVELWICVDPYKHAKLLAVCSSHFDLLTNLEVASVKTDAKLLLASQA